MMFRFQQNKQMVALFSFEYINMHLHFYVGVTKSNLKQVNGKEYGVKNLYVCTISSEMPEIATRYDWRTQELK